MPVSTHARIGTLMAASCKLAYAHVRVRQRDSYLAHETHAGFDDSWKRRSAEIEVGFNFACVSTAWAFELAEATVETGEYLHIRLVRTAGAEYLPSRRRAAGEFPHSACVWSQSAREEGERIPPAWIDDGVCWSAPVDW
eukprot:2295108-Pleurochrysis_carterae.AAC.5